MFKDKLFRFRSFNQYSLLELNNKTLWFSNVRSFNDPFEFRFEVDLTLPKDRNTITKFVAFTEEDLQGDHQYTQQQIQDFIVHFNKKLSLLSDQELEEKADTLLTDLVSRHVDGLFKNDETKVCCLSQSYDDPLMWSHYTDGMKGFVIVYNEFGTKEGSAAPALHVNYVEKIPIIDYQTLQLKSSSDGMKLNTKVFASKHKRWSYEKEIRFFSNPNHPYPVMRNIKLRDGGVMDLPDYAIHGVIVGCKMNGDNLKIIQDICSRSGYKLYQANLNTDQYKIDVVTLP